VDEADGRRIHKKSRASQTIRGEARGGEI